MKLGEAKQHKLTGVGGSTTQDAVELPRLTFTLANQNVELSPATVLLKKRVDGWQLWLRPAPADRTIHY